MNPKELHTLGIDIGSTTVKIAILDEENEVLFSDYERHYANIQETLSDLLGRALYKLGPIYVSPVIHRKRRSDTCQKSWRTLRSGGYSRVYGSSGLRSSDGCSH